MTSEIREFSVAETEAHLDALSGLLSDCVAAGANVNFVLPFPPSEARVFWGEKVLPSMVKGVRRLYVALVDGAVAGMVQLDTDMAPNGIHRCEVTKLMVHPNYRGHGLAKALMARHEAEAKALGKTLVVLDTKTGSEAEALYTSLGFTAAGQIPHFAREPDSDAMISTTYMYKLL